MAQTYVQLPVFLPGNDRDWTKHDGVATITDDGEIRVKLFDKRAAIDLGQMAKKNILLQLAFDYRMDETMIEHINNRYKEQ